MLPNLRLMFCATFRRKIVPCVNGNKSAQTILFYLIPILLTNSSKNAKWLINKQSMCAKCKLSQHAATLFKEQKNNVHSKTETPETKPASNSIHQQCHDFSNSDKIPIAKSDAKVFTDNFPFQELNYKELIKKQNDLCDAKNFINAQEKARVFNQTDEINSDG